MSEPRILVWFSCGAASLIAAKETIRLFPDREVLVVCCDTRPSEHSDNYRFSKDAERSVLEYAFLRGLDCKVMAAGAEFEGEYLFSASPIGDAFSASPEQSKEFSFIKLDNGWLTIQPTNHIVFRERSFTDNKLEFDRGLKRQTEVWSSE